METVAPVTQDMLMLELHSVSCAHSPCQVVFIVLVQLYVLHAITSPMHLTVPLSNADVYQDTTLPQVSVSAILAVSVQYNSTIL